MRERLWPRVTVLVLALAVVWPLPASAQESGTLQGWVINVTTGGRPVPGLEVTLNIYGADGGEETSTAQTDTEARQCRPGLGAPARIHVSPATRRRVELRGCR